MDNYMPFIFIAASPLILIGSIYFMVLKVSEPEKLMGPIAGGLSADRQEVVLQHKEWLAVQGYQYLTSFQFSTIQVIVFQQANAPRFFSLNFAKSMSYDLVTQFDDKNGLTTGTSGAIGMFPVTPGSYKQSFPNAAADIALQRHLEAETYIINKAGIVCQPITKPYEEIVVDGIRAQMKHVRSIALWPVRAVGWYFVNRKKMANLSVQQQFP
jgi:hypothetical protein